MLSKSKKIGVIIKHMVFCIALTICLVFGIFFSQLAEEEQTIDFKPAAVISIGFSAAIELFSFSKKNY